MTKPSRSTPKFLAPGGRAGNGHGYLTQPTRPLPLAADPPEVIERIAAATSTTDEPEAPSDAWVDAQAELAAEHNRLRHLAMVEQAREIRRELTVENRILEVQRRAKAQHVDVSTDLHIVRKMLNRSRNAGHKQEPPTAIRRLEQVENRLDGLPDAA